ncbi:MAG: YggS family pyridoxal phosphate-dependent enzyme [Bacteroidota bacterium]
MFKEVKHYCQERNVELVVVSKTRPIRRILELYNEGHRIFGENRVQELQQKYESMPKDIQWHMIGHLQSNKVKYIAPFVQMIHSGASLSLLKEINKRAKNNNRVIDVLLQVKIGQEDAKTGWSDEELHRVLEDETIQSFENIRVRGVMGMATFTNDKSVVRFEFQHLKSIYDQLKESFYKDRDNFDTISMGMSGDYKIAIEEGSTMVRVGSLIFQ